MTAFVKQFQLRKQSVTVMESATGWASLSASWSASHCLIESGSVCRTGSGSDLRFASAFDSRCESVSDWATAFAFDLPSVSVSEKQ